MVKVDFASHSPQMDPLRADLLDASKEFKPQPAPIPIYSTVTGTLAQHLAFDAHYWARNLREPVLFSAAVQHLLEDGHDLFLEISSHPILLSSIQQGVHHFSKDADQPGTVLPSMRRDEAERTVMLGSLGALYSLGYPIDWKRIYPVARRCVSLPMHPWNRERCWMESGAGDSDPQWEQVPRGAKERHPLLGRHFKSAHPAGPHFWEVTLDKCVLPYLDDHRIEGVAVLPASAYVEMALAAAAEAFRAEPLEPAESFTSPGLAKAFTIKDFEFRRALFLPDGEARHLQLILSPESDGAASIQIYSRAAAMDEAGKSWTLHATGRVCPQPDGSVLPTRQETLAEIQARCPETISGSEYYAKLAESGVYYGPILKSITQLWRKGGDVLGELQLPEGPDTEFSKYQIHPASLDACLQAAGAALATEAVANGKQGIFMPTRIDEINVHSRPGSHLWSYARVKERDADTARGDARLLDDDGHALVEILGLRFDSLEGAARRAVEENVDDWLYEFQWKEKPRPKEQELKAEASSQLENTSQVKCGTWLIFADRCGVGEALALQLEGQGARSILVSCDDWYEATDNTHYRIRPENQEDLRQLLATALANQSACRGIVHLWSLDAPAPDEITLASLTKAQSLGCGAVLQLVQELAGAELRDPPRLWLVTRGAQAAGEESLPIDVAQSPLWGMGRVIAQEHAAFWGGLVDIEPAAGASALDTAAHQLYEEISRPDGEDQIAFRDGRRLVGRLVRSVHKPESAIQQRALALRTDGSYLITGGLGDLGLVVARWMVERGARRLILLGRTKFPQRSSWSAVETGTRLAHQIGAIRELEAMGASIHLAPVDVADEEQLGTFLNEFSAEGWPPIRGVVHAAGVLQDGLLTQLDQAALTTVLRPKVMGGWLLHRLLADAPLDFFVLFSSAGSLLGQPGQGNYAAANAFLDALAHHRRAQHRPALSVNWGAWAELGFGDTTGGKRLAARLAMVGIRSMAPGQALEVLERMLRQGATQVAVVPVDWRQYHQFYSALSQSPSLSEVASEEAVNLAASPRGKHREALLAAEPAARLQLVQAYLGEQVARVLGFSASRLDVDQPLSNLGLDSLMAVELKNRISVDLGVNLPMVKFLQGPSVVQAATQILEQLTAELSTSPVSLTPAVGDRDEKSKNGDDDADGKLLAKLDELSDDEVNSMLIDMLDKAEISQ